MNKHWLIELYKKLGSKDYKQRCIALNFHRVLPQAIGDNPLDANEFVSKMRYIKRHFNVVSLPSFLEMKRNNAIEPYTVLITVDDGYEDSYSVISPILSELDLPASFFITTEGIDKGCLWNDRVEYAVSHTKKSKMEAIGSLPRLSLDSFESKSMASQILCSALKYMSIEKRETYIANIEAELAVKFEGNIFLSETQIQQMAAAGMTIGAHTHSHPILAVESDDEALKQIQLSKTILEQIIGEDVNYFAYPNGKFDIDFLDKHKTMLEQLGFIAALSTDSGHISYESDLLALKRFTPWDRSPSKFAFRLAHQFQNSLDF